MQSQNMIAGLKVWGFSTGIVSLTLGIVGGLDYTVKEFQNSKLPLPMKTTNAIIDMTTSSIVMSAGLYSFIAASPITIPCAVYMATKNKI